MKASAEKSTTPTKSSTTAKPTPFFSKAGGGGGFFAPTIQTKLKVNTPGDKFEQEADKTADKVMRSPLSDTASPLYISRSPNSVQSKAADGVPTVTPEAQTAIQNKEAGGQALSPELRSFMEPRFGADFSNVRLHTDAQAASLSNQLSARAFTHRNHIFFGRGQFQPDAHSGKHLLAHELTHTIQQGQSIQRSPTQAAPKISTVATPPPIQRLGLQDALDYFADKANFIPGFRLLTIVLGFNPINRRSADRSAANILRALIELLPGGIFITQALENHGVFAKAGAWVEQKLLVLGDIGGDIVAALKQFIDSLGWRDIFDLGGVWDRAKRIFTEPISRLIAFGSSTVSELIKLVKDAILKPLAALAKDTKGYDLLRAVLGEDPITGEAVPRTADNLIGGFMKLIGQEEIWANIKKGNAVARAFAWFQGALSGLLAFARAIPTRIMAILSSLTFADIVTVVGAFGKIVGGFATLAGEFISWGGKQVLGLLEILFSVVAPKAIQYIAKAKATFNIIIQDPIRFVNNLVKAGKLGFQLFADNILTHLKTALIKWLTGPLGEAGVYIPTSFSLMEMVKLVLSVLGLTWQNIRSKLVKIIPEPVLVGLEKTAGILVTLVKDGPAAAWEQIKTELTELKDQLIAQVTEMITTEVVKAAVMKLVSMLNPAGAVIQAILATYNTITFFIQKIEQIATVVASFIDSIAAIAAGQVQGAAKRVEQTMANTLVLIIGFLAKFAGLGNIPNKLVGVVKKIRSPIDKGLDKIVAWLGVILGKIKGSVTKAGKAIFAWWKTKKGFTDKDGESHSIYFDRQDQNAELVVASTPRLVHTILNEIGKTDDGKKVMKDIKEKMDKVRVLKLKITSLSDATENDKNIKEIEILVGQIGDLFAKISISGKNDKMEEITLSFERKYTDMDKEYKRQLKEQQDMLQSFTIAKWLTNRFIFEKKGRIDDGTLRKQINARNEDFKSYVAEQKKKGITSDKEIKKLWAYSAAATHSLDQVAGGDHYIFSNVGVHSVNSHLGTQWKAKVEDITNAIKKVNPKVYGTETMKVKLK